MLSRGAHFHPSTMKRESDASAADTVKKRKTITMELKVEIIKRSERGETPSVIGRALGYNRSTIGTILKDKGKIMEHVKGHTPMNATIITKRRSGLIIEMERLLMFWIEDQNQRNMPISLSSVQEKARSLFNDLKAARTASEGECNEEFMASKGWFQRFKGRADLHNITIQGEAPSADLQAASDFSKILQGIIDEGGYLADQIFNANETCLFWKKMPERTYISMEEKSAPGYKASKDRLALLVGGNASGDFKLTPLLVHHSLNLKALRNVTKASLPVIWMADKKAWVTAAVFQEWFLNHFIPAVEHYCLGKNIPFKILLLLDNAPGHPNTLVNMHPNVKVVFLPPNAASLLQPMDQGVIASFKAYYLWRTFSEAVYATQNDEMTLREFWKSYNIYDAIKNIADAWAEVKETTLRGAWKNVCPQFTQEFLGFTDDEIADTRQVVVAIGNELQLDITENDIIELLDSHDKELTNEDLMEIEQQIIAFSEENQDPGTPTKKFSTKELADAFRLIDAGMAKFEEQDPDTERFTKVYQTVTEGLACYKAIYDEKNYDELCANLPLMPTLTD
ncbi:tigger transposable element-derived protein 1-like [Pyxicephalus adspersus]|uniref:tigger transposable element-derived protein 1-like n=1 Tax=Pyxicephalus adspersus TaxID=30357 RepID=UPI003B59B4D0